MNAHIDIAYVEMHTLAYIYHWDRDTIRNLSRSERKKWVDMIKMQHEKEREEMKK